MAGFWAYLTVTIKTEETKGLAMESRKVWGTKKMLIMKNRPEKKKINKHQGCDRDHKTGCLQLPHFILQV